MSKFQRILCILIFTTLLAPLCGYASVPSDTLNSYGLFFHLSENFHSADFQKLPGVPNCCPRFESGSGSGFSIGALFERPVNEKFILGLRAGYYNYNGELSKDEPTVISVNGVATQGTFKHTLDAKLSSLGLDIYGGYKFFDNFTFDLGVNLGLLTKYSYHQKETLEGNGTFLDSNGVDTKSAIRNDLSGDIPNVSKLNANIIAGVTYALPLNKNKNLRLCPEIFYSYNITDVASDLKWNVNSLKIGAAIKYSFLPEKETRYENIEKIDTIRIEKSDIIAQNLKIGAANSSKKESEKDNIITITEYLQRTDTLFYPKTNFKMEASIEAFGLDANGNANAIAQLRVEEFVSSRLQPLLNYVFFDEGKSEINSRYKALNSTSANDFTEDKLFFSTTLETYYQLLNIIGYRLKNNPDAKLTITGCNDGSSAEKENSELSKMRANKVGDYLKEVWKIDANRLKIVSRDLPASFSSPIADADKAAENRRVELFSDNYEIAKPIYLNDTIRKSNPPVIRFKPSEICEAGLKSWKITASQGGATLKTIEGGDNIESYYDWKLESEQTSMPRLQKPLDYKLSIIDKKERAKESELKSLRTDMVTVQTKRAKLEGDKEIDNYSLIVFDFDKSEIKGANQKIVDFINSRISPTAKVKITGYTDRTGEAEHNKDLSESRAKAVQSKLKVKNCTAEGMGAETLLYDNGLPEGRFYCRTVNILVETPVK